MAADLKNNPLNLVEGNLIVAAIVKLSRARAFMRRHLLAYSSRPPLSK
jgi:hypothetical protein